MRKTLEERFWQKVNKTDGCWEWIAAKAGGYGHINLPGSPTKKILSHRLSYQIANGKIPDGYVIDHLCRNKGCVNPAHLEAVTPLVNIERGIQPGMNLHLLGECANGHKLAEDNSYLFANKRRKNGSSRVCKTCKLARAQKARDIKKAQKEPKLYCKRGHLFSGDNLYISPSGVRTCKICKKGKMKEWHINNKPNY